LDYAAHAGHQGRRGDGALAIKCGITQKIGIPPTLYLPSFQQTAGVGLTRCHIYIALRGGGRHPTHCADTKREPKNWQKRKAFHPALVEIRRRPLQNEKNE
jgi:hypothetical protein